MVMHSCGSHRTILVEQEHLPVAGDLCKATELSPGSPVMCQMEDPCEVATLANDSVTLCSSEEKNSEDISLPLGGIQKRQKLAEEARLVEATENAVIKCLRNNVYGVALSEIFGSFKGSDEDAVRALLSRLEGEFIIYKKNGLYKLF